MNAEPEDIADPGWGMLLRGAPEFADPVEQLRARLLQAVLYVVLSVAVLAMLTALAFTTLADTVVVGISASLHVVCLALLRKRRMQAACMLLLANFLGTALVFSLTREGLYEASMLLFPLMSIIAALILERVMFWLFSAAALSCIVAIGALHLAGFYGTGPVALAHEQTLPEQLLTLLLLVAAVLVLARLCIDHLIRAVRSMHASNALLRDANQELATFTHSISHDLRSPLRAINGYAELLASEHGARLDHEAKRLLQRIGAASLRLDTLNDALLGYSRLNSRRLRSASLRPQEILAPLCRALEQAHPQRSIEWRIGALPEVRADPDMLRQLFERLLDNAVKFSAPRERTIVEIGAATDAGRTVFHVRDNGVGFDPAHAGKLFTVFQRLHAPGEFAGDGIGLAFASRIVRRHGGSIRAESAPGSGATFFFTLAP